MEPSRLHREIYFNLEKAENILIIIHQSPDGDAIGSGLSLANYLRREKKKYTLFSLDPPSSQFSYLSGIGELNNDISIFSNYVYDLTIVLDSGDLKYAGVAEFFQADSRKKSLIINIDHHHTNQMFGDLNLVDPQASSTAEILYSFFDDLRIEINKEMATSLLTGILLDTGAFSNPATTIDSLEAASRLLIMGADPRKIVAHSLKNKKLSTLKLWGKALSRLKKDERTGFVTTIITKKDIEECRADEEATEGVSNFLNNLSDTKAVMVLMELSDGRIKGSLRSNDDLIDVAKIATILGGGGHKKAAGFTVRGHLEETKRGWQVV